MATTVDSILRSHGPCLSSDLVQHLIDCDGISLVAAKKRVSRAAQTLKRLHIYFPNRTAFLYLPSQFGSDEYWDALIKALIEKNTAYGLALAALQQRGGLMPRVHFPISCGAPDRMAKRLSHAYILDSLIKAGLVQLIDLPGLGECVALVQGPDRYDAATAQIQARLLVERVLLLAIADWARKLGLCSHETVRTRDDENLPAIGQFSWDLTAVSYLGALVTRKSATESMQGFIACDILLGVQLTEAGLAPFVRKCETLRTQGNIGRCLQIFVADRYDKDAFDLAKSKGILPATPDTLFGREVAEGLVMLQELLTQTTRLLGDYDRFDEIFRRLTRFEGAVGNIRGALFEYLVADIVRGSSGRVDLNVLHKDGNGGKAEVDVEAHTGVAAIRFIECKGYAPYQELPEQEWKHWLEKIPVIERSARALYGPKTKLQFELWTTGKLSTEAIAIIEKQASLVRPTKYALSYMAAAAVRDAARATQNDKLIATLEQHFLSSVLPAATKTRRGVPNPRSLATKESIEATNTDLEL